MLPLQRLPAGTTPCPSFDVVSEVDKHELAHGDRLRVTDTKRDDPQLAVARLRKTRPDVSLQLDNFLD